MNSPLITPTVYTAMILLYGNENQIFIDNLCYDYIDALYLNLFLKPTSIHDFLAIINNSKKRLS